MLNNIWSSEKSPLQHSMGFKHICYS